MVKINSKTSGQHQNNIIDVVQVFLLLTLGIFHIFWAYFTSAKILALEVRNGPCSIQLDIALCNSIGERLEWRNN